MSKVTKKQLQREIQRQERRIDNLVRRLAENGFYDKESEPQLKQLDQSVFNGLDEKWLFAAVDANGRRKSFKEKPYIKNGEWLSTYTLHCNLGLSYDTSNWQNSLIDRDIAKEPLEVDLSSELTGSELCKAMLAKGDKYVMCAYDNGYDNHPKAISISEYGDLFYINGDCKYGVLCGNIYPINNQGEPLTAAEAGL